ncbi:MAG TPA: hypothetical protein VIL46_14660 [Gemmataceae bacterium]
MPDLVRRIDQRLRRETTREQVGRLLTASYILAGFKDPEQKAKGRFRGSDIMHESETYQAIVEEGEAKGRIAEAREMVLRQGQKRFGEPDEAVRSALLAVTDRGRLERMNDRLWDGAAKDWSDLLSTP